MDISKEAATKHWIEESLRVTRKGMELFCQCEECEIYELFDTIEFLCIRALENLNCNEEEYLQLQQYRKMFRLMYNNGIKFEDICKNLGISYETLFCTDW